MDAIEEGRVWTDEQALDHASRIGVTQFEVECGRSLCGSPATHLDPLKPDVALPRFCKKHYTERCHGVSWA